MACSAITISSEFGETNRIRTSHAEYAIAVQLAKGAFATLYVARVVRVFSKDAGRRLRAGMKVILKVPYLPPSVGHEQALDDHLQVMGKSHIAEAHALRTLSGLDCVPQLLDTGTTDAVLGVVFGNDRVPVPFLAIELLEGKDLAEYLTDRNRGSGGEFRGVTSAAVFFQLARQLAKTLLKIHRRQVIHGDIWPKNIMVCGDKVYFVDFGQAVRRDLSPGGLRQRIGNHPYLAPEGSGRITSDVYALAGVFYFLATGQAPPPTQWSDTATKAAVLAGLAAQNPKLILQNRGIADIIARGLRGNPARRLQTVDAVLYDIDLFEPASRTRPRRKTSSIQDDLLAYVERQRCIEVDAIKAGVYDMCRSDDQFATWMTRLLSLLQRGDEYSTVTTARFWKAGNAGADGRFLSMNVVKAIQGVAIDRVFILQKGDLEDEEVRLILRGQLDSMREVAVAGSTRRKPVMYSVRYLELTQADFDEVVRSRRHCGMIQAGGLGAVVVADYDETNRISASRLHLVQSLFQTQKQAFEKLRRESVQLTALEERLRG